MALRSQVQSIGTTRQSNRNRNRNRKRKRKRKRKATDAGSSSKLKTETSGSYKSYHSYPSALNSEWRADSIR